LQANPNKGVVFLYILSVLLLLHLLGHHETI
jgi:hypothetical protein